MARPAPRAATPEPAPPLPRRPPTRRRTRAMPGTSHLPPFEAYNDDDPVAFYLSENVRTELEEGADAVFLCEGRCGAA